MDARVVYFDGCPNWRVAGDRLRLALDRSGHPGVQIRWVRVEIDEYAATAGFAGSPTLLIDGNDVFPSAAVWTGGLACRLYRTSGGPVGAPTVDGLVAALRERG
jgi:hypothetical protein